MAEKRNIAQIVKDHRTLFIIIGVILFLLELEIFAVSVMKSGRKSELHVFDAEGNVIHITDGKSLSDFNKYYFEKTFGPLEDYKVKLVSTDRPFPFRAWLVAAVGIPIGIVLMFGFIIKAYVSLFYGDEMKSSEPDPQQQSYQNHFEKVVSSVSKFNIFAIGFIVLLGLLAFWTVPNLITYLGKVGLETISRFKWYFIAASVVAVGFLAWIIYLRYLLAKKAIESQTEVDKYRMKLELAYHANLPPQLDYDGNPSENRPMVSWDPDADPDNEDNPSSGSKSSRS